MLAVSLLVGMGIRAYWHQPEGPGRMIIGNGQYPVVHIACEDAEAYE